ncbi:glycoside hydrolase 5 family protein [Rubrolithibacter danxiaensis]|uniref:glycoside hydrolase 5 family protein n=1 Tax=Rubrolithibacter danxiaensis TaxID=3390805 RepID=UPI003BF8D45A
MIKNSLLLLAAILFFFSCGRKKQNNENSNSSSPFVKVNGQAFEVNGEAYFYLGTNFWYGLNLGSKGAGGNRERLIRELDRLKAMGINNLRIVAGSEGPDTEPWRMLPSLQPSPGKYNPEVLDGLDFLMYEMGKRKMYAIMCLNNFWPWSGGMGQYLVWAGAADSIPYPPPHPGGDWGKYAEFTAQFYSNQKAMDLFNKHIEFIVNRKNPYTGTEYKNDPTIMSWELANEPRGVNNIKDFLKWVDNTAGLIKRLDSNHLVTTGSEGKTSDSKASGTNLEKDHTSKNIDYATIHIWVQNWGFYDPDKADSTYPAAVKYAIDYIDDQVKIANRLNKPLVLEEFGISRDLNNHAAETPTQVRDKYYKEIFEEVYNRAAKPEPELAGVNFWAWGGEGRPRIPKGVWKMGDDFIGDPPHEFQGWYSVYDTDSSTIAVIKQYADKMNSLGNK